jgi:hypothetical protein
VQSRQKKKKQIDVTYTQVGIGHSHQLAGQVEGEQNNGKWREGKKA